jgi:hypothetical protein
MKQTFVLVAGITFTFASGLFSQQSILLWPQGAPGALGQAPDDIPTLTPYLAAPDQASGAAIVVCPGGGYGGLASHEGPDYALFLPEGPAWHRAAGQATVSKRASLGARLDLLAQATRVREVKPASPSAGC